MNANSLSKSSRSNSSQSVSSLGDTGSRYNKPDKQHIPPKGLRSGTSTPSNDAIEAEGAEPTWSAEELLEVRARERTFDGAYWRTSVGLFGASLVILRVFGLSFFPVGLVFLALGLGFLAIGLFRRYKLLNKDAHAQGPFVTSGGTVLLSGSMCLLAYAVLLVLLLRI